MTTNFITRDQKRAKWAYESVEAVASNEPSSFEDYKIAVNGLGANIIRSGLSGTFAFLERDKSKGATSLLLKHLAGAQIPGMTKKVKEGDFKDVAAAEFAAHVRQLDVGSYMLVTREILKLTLWLKRAIQATPKPAKK